jgi:hypothetical protein
MSADRLRDDADESYSFTDTLFSFVRQGSIWLGTLFLLGIATWSYGPADEAPGIYPVVFVLFAGLMALYGLEKMDAAPNLVRKAIRF